ncbi:hypothetical protein DFP95_101460 [Cohnella lupini]|uniref:Uncharacterized protein n=1 Tax=Cohnella lupini TaxID=1294267 RepID=A0A3D9IW51_9BACL|nr:hypothetical protein DFP95_101460 [Cohnella lupini]
MYRRVWVHDGAAHSAVLGVEEAQLAVVACRRVFLYVDIGTRY